MKFFYSANRVFRESCHLSKQVARRISSRGLSGFGKENVATCFLAESVCKGEHVMTTELENILGKSLNSMKHYLMIRTSHSGVKDTLFPDLSIYKTLHDLSEMFNQIHAKRNFMNSLSTFQIEKALPDFSMALTDRPTASASIKKHRTGNSNVQN